MDNIISVFIGGILGFIFALIMLASVFTANDDIALKLSNMVNSSMLDCVTKQVITKEQVHDIESIFHKHIEENFKGIKASHGTENK
uniref:Uncharacterized protein n=1 Tax=Podoviridae sp. ctIKM86 TaxID=2827729 RepID=A0A8S5SMW0_9CAUD|nr:MAG TPA: hypothetical protein [Podoviridae sp. ctIKM86]